MSVTYEIDREIGLIRTRCVGDVTFADVERHFRELRNDAFLPERLDVLLDLTRMDSVPETDQLTAVAEEVEDLQRQVKWHSFAVVANNDVLFGMSRVLHAFAEPQFVNSHVFRELEEAEDWLASLRPPGA